MKLRISSILAALLIAVSVFGFTSNANAQARPSSKGNIISVEPLGLLGIGNFKHIHLQYEWRASNDNSWAVRGFLVPTSGNTSAFGFGGSYRFYIADSRALTGFNISPSADIFLITWGSQNYTSFSVGGDAAYKWIFDSFGVEPYFRLRQYFTGDESDASFSGMEFNVGVYLGYAW